MESRAGFLDSGSTVSGPPNPTVVKGPCASSRVVHQPDDYRPLVSSS